jgi:membrane protein DedA with SNARE-associated domain
MYGITLWLHSQLRWVLLIVLLLAIVQSYQGWFGNKPWTDKNKKLNLITLIASHLQLVIGLLLYFALSPIVQSALKNMKGAMKHKTLRFWAVEHIALMIIALVLIQIGYSKAKRAKEDVQKHKSAALFFTFGLLAILAAIPWPMMAKFAGRPWFRLGF